MPKYSEQAFCDNPFSVLICLNVILVTSVSLYHFDIYLFKTYGPNGINNICHIANREKDNWLSAFETQNLTLNNSSNIHMKRKKRTGFIPQTRASLQISLYVKRST